MATPSNFLDRAIGFFSPVSEAKRIRARALVDELRDLRKRGYEGASRGRRTAGWKAPSSSANTELVTNLEVLRNRSRDLVRNNPYTKRAISVIASNTIGTGIIPQTRSTDERLVKSYEEIWKEWGDETACDADGRCDFYGLQSLAMRTIAESGEVLVVRLRRKASDNLPLPFQIRVLEPDHLDSTKDGLLSNGGRIVQGVEFDIQNRRVAYHLFREHPGDYILSRAGLASVRVQASEVLHIFRPDRAGQVRGIPWGASVFLRTNDLDGFEDAYLVRQKIAACFTAFVRDMEGDSDTQQTTYQTLGGLPIDRLEPGTIETLPPGKDITFANPPSPTGYSEHTNHVLRAIAIGFDISYEALTANLSEVNFSSGRMGWLEFQRAVDQWRLLTLEPQLNKPTWSWFVEAAIVSGRVRAPASATWTPPRREMIDPVKETLAMKTAVRNGFMSLSETIRQSGRDPGDVFDEMAADQKILDEKGLILDSDPRRRTSIGYDPNGAGTTLKEADDDSSKTASGE